jgi:hypothetical protein
VCDNSTPGNTETAELIERLNSPKIRYIRAPRDLPMTKNFEHALLNAKGEFVLILGSDDGLMFHGLEYLERILKENPDEEIIQWNRGFYVWSDLTVYRQNGQFTIPKASTESVTHYNSFELMKCTLQSLSNIYVLPLFYYNSGFRRSYVKRLLEKTGRIYDGVAPDIYTGVINLSLNPTILYVPTPLTFAGMCGNSNGVKFTSGSKNVEKISKDMMSVNIGHCVPGALDELMPVTSVDVSMLIAGYLRCVGMGANSNFTKDLVSWESVFDYCARAADKTNVKFDLYMRQLTYAAFLKVEGLGHWFERGVLPSVYASAEAVNEESEISESDEAKKSFDCGFSDSGLTLDAERFGVTDIYGACELFDKLYNL